MMKNHQMVDGRLLQADKRFSGLRQKQQEKITEWLYEEYRRVYLATGKEPGPKLSGEIVGAAYDRIEAAEIWIPYSEVVRRYRSRKPAFRGRFHRELDGTEPGVDLPHL